MPIPRRAAAASVEASQAARARTTLIALLAGLALSCRTQAAPPPDVPVQPEVPPQPGGVGGRLPGSLPVTLHPQEASLWCWAASGQMIMSFLGHPVSQCEQANAKRADAQLPKDCPCQQCGPGAQSSNQCDRSGWPQFTRYGFTFGRTKDQALSWDELKSQVCQGANCKETPIAFTWRWDGGGGHMMVAIGAAEVEGERFVSVLDPLEACAGGESIIPYDQYDELSGEYTHWDDFFDITFGGS